MVFFAKDYHPLDSRHPRNRTGAKAGTYGVQTAKSKVRAKPLDTSMANGARGTEKVSQTERIKALAAETQARQRQTAQAQRQKETLAPTSAPIPQPTSKPRSPLSKMVHILANVGRNFRIGMLIAALIYIATQPGMLSSLVSMTSHGGSVDLMQTMPRHGSTF
jgi:hypothetical protein